MNIQHNHGESRCSSLLKTLLRWSHVINVLAKLGIRSVLTRYQGRVPFAAKDPTLLDADGENIPLMLHGTLGSCVDL